MLYGLIIFVPIQKLIDPRCTCRVSHAHECSIFKLQMCKVERLTWGTHDTYWVLQIEFTPQRLLPFVVQRTVSNSARADSHIHTSWEEVLQVLTLLIAFDTPEVHRICTVEITHWLQSPVPVLFYMLRIESAAALLSSAIPGVMKESS